MKRVGQETIKIDSVYRMIDEKNETSDDNENKYQTLRMYDENNEGTIGEVKAYLTVHNIYIEEVLMEESTNPLVPWSLQQCRQTQLQKIFDASINDTHKLP
eukprot:5342876-Amphidinium_carterae.1